PVSIPRAATYALERIAEGYEIRNTGTAQTLRIRLSGREPAAIAHQLTEEHMYALEAARGYESRGELRSPGAFEVGFDDDGIAALTASVEPWQGLSTASPVLLLEAETRRRLTLQTQAAGATTAADAALVFAADQFLVAPAFR